jgi:hypothetical protein
MPSLTRLENFTSNDSWALAGHVAQMLVTGIANKAKDQADEELDAKRVHQEMTLDEFLAKK